MKDYLGYENQRNHDNAQLYVDIVKRAFGETNTEVLIGHHITFEQNGVLASENEIPSADCLMFDHDIMTRVFGGQALHIMQELAAIPCTRRDEVLREHFEATEESQVARAAIPTMMGVVG